MFDKKKVRYLSVILGLFIASSELSAQTITWGSAHAVPMSLTSIIIMAVLFLLIGIWILKKSQSHAQRLLFSFALMAVSYNYTVEATAWSHTVDIMAESGTADLDQQGTTQVLNSYDAPVTILNIDPHGCTIGSNTCTIGTTLDPGEYCLIEVLCGG